MRCSLDGGVFQCGECQTDSDCPSGQGCVPNRQTRLFQCLDTECETDVHCFEGFVCRSATVGATGPVIHRCVPDGLRREGETCDLQFVSRAGACREGLVCHRGVCTFPCGDGAARSCPEGYTCQDNPNGPVCASDCRVRGCAEGQQCKRLSETDYQCLESVEGECPETPCAQGERCSMRLSRGRGVFWCAQLCEPFRTDSCPEGQICGMAGGSLSTCYRQCNPVEPDSCGEGWQCVTVSEDMTQWGCKPAVPQ